MTVALRFLAALVLTLGFQTHAFALAVTASAKAGPCAVVAALAPEAADEKGIVSSETPSPSCKVIGAEPQGAPRKAAQGGDRLRFEWPDHGVPVWNPAGLEKPPKGAPALS